MKFFSKIDIISPPITLYYKDELLHPSLFSGILSIICYILMVCFGLNYLIVFFQKKNPTAYYFNRYVEEAGNFPMNSSSIFASLQLCNTSNENRVMKIDFDSVRFIGVEKSIDTYTSNTNLTNYDHWIYGNCNNDTDIKGISNLIDVENFKESTCIRKFYNKNEKKYYETNEKNFRWPELAHGSSNPNVTLYGIIVEKCKNDSLRTNLEKKFCKSDSEINEYMAHVTIRLQVIDHLADVLNFKEPFTKYFYQLTNGIFNETYVTNHLNFYPAIMKTHKGILFEKIDEKYAYFFNQNEKITSSSGNTGIYIAFYFWMQNTMQYYERKYQLLQDVMSNVGGVTRTILSVASIINYIFSRYVTLVDSEELFIDQNEKSLKEKTNNKNDIEKQIKKNIENPNPPKRFSLYSNYQYQNNNILSNNSNYMSKDKANYPRLSRDGADVLYNFRNSMQKIGKKNQNKYLFYNKTNYFYGNNYISYERKEKNKKRLSENINPSYFRKNNNLKNDIDNSNKYFNEKDNIGDIKNISDNCNNDKCNKNEFNFWKFLSYIVSCCKNNEKMNYIEELRYKILSEETIVQNYLILKEVNKLSEFIK